MTVLSWLAVLVGFSGTWVAGRRRVGWLVGACSAAMWLVYDVERSIPAGAFAAAVAVGLSVRNFVIGRRPRAAVSPVVDRGA